MQRARAGRPSRAPVMESLPVWLAPGLWGTVAGGALVLGAALGYALPLSRRAVAGVMAFGAGVLVAALGFELMEEPSGGGDVLAAVGGFAGGALAYTLASRALEARNAARRRAGARASERRAPAAAGGVALAVGAVIDGIPEPAAIGITCLEGAGVSLAMVAAIFVSNVPEGLSSAAEMRRAGRSLRAVLALWLAVALASGAAAVAGYALARGLDPAARVAMSSFAAGGILAMLADTMIPEAYEDLHAESGLLVSAGFLAAYLLSAAT